jgi:putative LysE/RhtB family amino acid efflux pump
MMMNQVSLVAGLLVGFAVAVPIGPMGLLCIQRTLASGMAVGVSTGLGAATVNVAYGAVVLFGLDTLSPWIASSQRLLGVLSGLFLLWSAARTLWRRGTIAPLSETQAPSPLAAYASAVAFNATNPMAMILILALLSPIIGHAVPSWTGGAALLFGMFAAATTWWVCLSGGVALLRTRLSPNALIIINRAAGLLLTVYGALALAHSAAM